MKYMRVRVHAGYIVDMLTYGSIFYCRCIEGLPVGTKFVYAIPDTMYGIWIVVEHESFDELKQGQIIPEYPAPRLEKL